LGYAQVTGSAQSSSASRVAAEVTKGKLNPAESKPGDSVVVRLKDDVKSNGEVIVKKGTSITGVVRNVKRAEANGRVQSMMEIEWLAPAGQGKAAQSLSFALQSVTQVNPIYKFEQENAAANDFGLGGGGPASAPNARPVRTSGSSASSGGLLGDAGSTSGSAVNAASSAHARSQSNTALLKMPMVVAVDHQTSSAIESSLGASSGALFNVGHGQLVTSNGSKQSLDIYSHLNNDTVITSSSKDFEISSGAQMQMLVGVNKK
jgi:hypothetical protein